MDQCLVAQNRRHRIQADGCSIHDNTIFPISAKSDPSTGFQFPVNREMADDQSNQSTVLGAFKVRERQKVKVNHENLTEKLKACLLPIQIAEDGGPGEQ